MMQSKKHYAFVILLAGCLIQAGTLGAVVNTRGIFYDPVTSDLGFGLGPFTLYLVIFAIFCCLPMPVIGKIFPRSNIRVLMTVMALIFGLSVCSMASFHHLWEFYAAGAIQGVTGAFLLYFPVPLLISNWFDRGRGKAVGLAMGIAGISGIVLNPLGNAVIGACGWRVGYLFFGIACLVFTLPATLFLICYEPSQKGLKPYGYCQTCVPSSDGRPEQSQGIPFASGFKTAAFLGAFLTSLFAGMLIGLYTHLQKVGILYGYSSETGALLISMSMAGNIGGKLVLGWLYDRAGILKTIYAGAILTAAGLAMLLVPSLPFLYLGSLLFGFSFGLSCVIMPLYMRESFGSRDYSRFLSWSTVAGALGPELTGAAFGFLYDFQGSYSVSIVLSLVLCFLVFFLSGMSLQKAKKLWVIS